MNDAPSTTQDLIEFRVDRVIDETTTETRIVVLTRTDSPTVTFPIWVGAAEGAAIKLAMDPTVTPRPMSHDLIRSMIEHLGVAVRRVVITDVKSSTYYATVYLENKGVERTVDARPSDAISLALRTHCPIYVSQQVLTRRNNSNLDVWLAKMESKNIGSQEVRDS
jgi:bifunctional DNase/RNase